MMLTPEPTAERVWSRFYKRSGAAAHAGSNASGVKRIRLAAGAAAGSAFLAILLTGCGANSAPAGLHGMPPALVEVTPVVKEHVELHTEWVATIDGSVNAQIQPQVTGYLIRQNYREGSFVRKGQVLFEIDPRPMQAALDQARAVLSQAESEVVQAETAVTQADSEIAQTAAQLRKAELDVKRDEPLAAARAVPQSQLDTELQVLAATRAALDASKARAATSRAGVKTARSAVMAARANVEQAELNLGFTKVESLIDGIAGVAQTQIGNLVKPDTVLTSVSKVDPIRVYFPISESEYLEFMAPLKGNGQRDLLRTSKGSLELILTNGAVYPHRGSVAFTDREVDATTGTIRIAAEFANPGNVLRPGQFGRIRTVSADVRDALLIPQRAVTEVQGQPQVAVVGADNKVETRVVKLGSAIGTRYIVESGLKAGEQVVVEGVGKAFNGSTVSVKPAAAGDSAGRKAD